MLKKSDKFAGAITCGALAVNYLFHDPLVGWLCILGAIGFYVAFRMHQESKGRAWREVSVAFKELETRAIAASHRLHNPLTKVGAWHAEPPHKTWMLNSHDPECNRDAELLCGRAGALLLSSGNVKKTLSASVVRATNDKDRWLYFLKDIGEEVPAHLRSSSDSSVDGVSSPTLYHIEIRDVPKSSVRGCIECLRLEGD